MPYRVVLNVELVERLKTYGQKNCYLWTKANPQRVEAILKHCNLKEYFHKVIFDDKIAFRSSMLKLKAVTHSRELMIYENNHKFFEDMQARAVELIRTDWFHVVGYWICG